MNGDKGIKVLYVSSRNVQWLCCNVRFSYSWYNRGPDLLWGLGSSINTLTRNSIKGLITTEEVAMEQYNPAPLAV